MTGVHRRARLAWYIVVGILIMVAVGCGDSRTEPMYAPLRHPFRGAELFLDTDSLAGRWQRQNAAAWLDPIVGTPQARWLTGPDDLDDLPAVLTAARDQGGLLVLVAYYIPNLDCAGPEHGARDAGQLQEGAIVDRVDVEYRSASVPNEAPTVSETYARTPQLLGCVPTLTLGSLDRYQLRNSGSGVRWGLRQAGEVEHSGRQGARRCLGCLGGCRPGVPRRRLRRSGLLRLHWLEWLL